MGAFEIHLIDFGDLFNAASFMFHTTHFFISTLLEILT